MSGTWYVVRGTSNTPPCCRRQQTGGVAAQQRGWDTYHVERRTGVSLG
jgi:hypothetical protein